MITLDSSVSPWDHDHTDEALDSALLQLAAALVTPAGQAPAGEGEAAASASPAGGPILVSSGNAAATPTAPGVPVAPNHPT